MKSLTGFIDALEEFPVLTGMADDIDAFADETGYEGTFVDREFLFPSITNPNHEHYDNFDPYEEDECIITGTIKDKNIYGFYEQEEDNTPFEDHRDQLDSHQKDEDPSKLRGKKRNTFMPYADEGDESTQNDQPMGNQKEDGEFAGYADRGVGKEKAQKSLEPTAEDTETFLGYHQQENQNDQSGTNLEEDKEPRDSIRNIEDKRNEMETPAAPVFQRICKADLPMTAKVDSILSQELKNVTLDESHFMLPVPESGDPTGIKIKVYLFGTKE